MVPAPDAQPRRPGVALLVIAAAQLMVVLDNTITNIALPSIQRDLDVSASSLAWIVTSYALAFGGLLLLGGRAGDLYGRRRVFRAGIAVFTLASLLGGFAPNGTLLIAARVLQGVGAAVAAPTALSLIAVNFPEGRPRNRAMGVYAAMAGAGATLGLLLGGALTDWLNWHWVLWINVPIGAAVLAGTRVLAEGDRRSGRLDIPGALTGTAGLVCLVYAITRGGADGWTDAVTVGAFAAALLLLPVFLGLQSRTGHPVLPLPLLRDRDRAGSYATMLFIGAGMFATFYFLTLYMQIVLGYSPVRTGLAYLPFSAGMGLASGVGARVAGRFAPRTLAAPGLVVGALGLFWLSTLTSASSYPAHLMPAMFVTALGLGTAFLPMTLGAVRGVDPRDTGIASALLNTAQQIGGALGLAVLATVASSVTEGARTPAALTDGYTAGFGAAALLFLVGLAVTATAITAGRPEPVRPADAPADAPADPDRFIEVK